MLIRILVIVLCTAVARGIVMAFGLDQMAAHTIDLAWSSTKIKAVAWMLSGLIGLLGLALWIALRLDKKLGAWLNPRPEFASLVYSDFIPNIGIDPKNKSVGVETFVKLDNTNTRSVRYRAKLTGSINGHPFRDTVGKDFLEFNGFAGAGRSAGLVLQFQPIAFDKAEGWATIDGQLRYELTYYFDGSFAGRATARTILFKTTFPWKAKPGQQLANQATFLFRDEHEE